LKEMVLSRTKKESLHIARATIQRKVQALLGLAARGDDAATALPCYQRQRLDEVRAVAGFPRGLVQQLDIQLEEVRLQCNHLIQHGIAGTEVVHGDADASTLVAGSDLPQAIRITLQPRDLEDYPLRW